MLTNPVIDLLLRRASIRKFTEEEPSKDVIETIVRCGQQAPFAAQLASFALSRDRATNPFGAPLLFTILVDVHRLERVMSRRGWRRASADGPILLFGIQDASLAAENMVIAGESLGLGSCFLGAAPFRAAEVARSLRLPKHVFPLVELAMGYPAEAPPPRPRYPIRFSLHEGGYSEADADGIDAASSTMDRGYLAQDYYREAGYMVPIDGDREETFSFDDYSWTEHMGRKWGQWLKEPGDLLDPLQSCGFNIAGGAPSEEGDRG